MQGDIPSGHRPWPQQPGEIIADKRTDENGEQKEEELTSAQGQPVPAGQQENGFIFYFTQFLPVKGLDRGFVALFEALRFFQLLFDNDADMIEQIVLKTFQPDAASTYIAKNKIDLLFAKGIHQVIFGLMSNREIIVSIKLANSFTFSLACAFPVGLKL